MLSVFLSKEAQKWFAAAYYLYIIYEYISEKHAMSHACPDPLKRLHVSHAGKRCAVQGPRKKAARLVTPCSCSRGEWSSQLGRKEGASLLSKQPVGPKVVQVALSLLQK